MQKTLLIVYIDPWVVKAYDQLFVGATAHEAMAAADAYGEKHQLRPVSLIATRV